MGSLAITNRGQYLTQAKTFNAKQVELEAPGPGEVQIATRSTTLCGSDLHYHSHGRNGSIVVREPLCLGHECAGEVVALGSDVNHLQIGDQVAVECGVPCSNCQWCQSERYNLCPQLRFRGSGAAFPHFQGTLQERLNHPAKWLHRLPASLSSEDGALLEPLAVACHAVRRAQVVPSSTCLIIGAGPIGLLCAAVALAKGCSHIAICDIDERRLEFALKHGYAHVGLTVERKSANNIEEELMNARGLAEKIWAQHWPDGSSVGRLSITFECTGVPSCVQTSIYATRPGGRVMLVGMGTPNHTLPLSEAGAKEIDLMPSWRYANCYGEAIELMDQMTQGLFKPDVRKLITHRFSGLDAAPQAFELASCSQDPVGNLVMKVVVNT